MVNLNLNRPKTHLVIPDPHAHPDYNNKRADYLGKLINDLKPDVVVNLGDMFDMPSLASYDKGKRSFHGRAVSKDLEAGLDFDDRLWWPARKSKKKRPHGIFFEGNHEYRLKRALDIQPELDGVLSFDDFDLSKNYHEVVEYDGSTPGTLEVDGVVYAHYHISGIMGRSISGEHPAYSLISKKLKSATCGHIHTTDFDVRTSASGKKIMGLVAGVYQDYNSPWAGSINKLWWRGVIVKRNVEDGCYSPQWISIDELKKEYGNGST